MCSSNCTKISYSVDLKAMGISRYKFGQEYKNAYHSHIPMSPPGEDLEARLALYSLRRYRSFDSVDRLCLISALSGADGRQAFRSHANDNSSYLHESTLYVLDAKPRQNYVCYQSACIGKDSWLTTRRLVTETRKLVEMFSSGLE